MSIRWSILLGCLLVILTGCAVGDDRLEKSQKRKQASDGRSESEAEILFSYEETLKNKFQMHSFRSNEIGNKLLFIGEQRTGSDTASFVYVANEAKESWNARDALSLDEYVYGCSDQTAISPNGDLVAFACEEDEDFFVIYHLLNKDTVYRATDEKFSRDDVVIDIMNNGEVILMNAQEQTITYFNIYSEEKTVLELDELLNIENPRLYQVLASNDGSRLIINTGSQLDLIERNAHEYEVTTLAESGDYLEGKKSMFFNVELSQNGEYIYFRNGLSQTINENTMTTVMNVSTDEQHHYNGLDMYHLRGISNKGEVLLNEATGEKNFLYSFEEKLAEQLVIDKESYDETSKTIQLSPSGRYIFYNQLIEEPTSKKHLIHKLELSPRHKQQQLQLEFNNVDLAEASQADAA